MGEMAILVNHTRGEYVGKHLPFDKPSEWTFNIVAGAMTTWYMLRYRQDDVRFFGEYQDDREFGRLISEYRDATDQVADAMVEEGILADHGRRVLDEADPGNVYTCDLRPRRSYFRPPPDQLGLWGS